jgi:cytochrome c biogenesis protein CcdA/thiol-disulfide isomerase/thioredoxin
MVLFALVYLGGVLTIVSPCILPVLPFVFARADRPFVRSGLPLLVGMGATFAAVAALAAVAGSWAVQANQYGRILSMALLALFGIALLFPALSDRMMGPLVGLGARLSQSADHGSATGGPTVTASLLLGVATGLLWAPCAGPILGLILTGAALQGASAHTTLLLLAYAAGAATSLALALLVGGRVLATLKRSLGMSDWIRRGLGVAVLAAVGAIALGLDTGVLARVSLASTTALEQRLLDTFHPAQDAHAPSSSVVMTGGDAMMSANSGMMMKARTAGHGEDLTVEGTLPSLAGAVAWLNSAPLTAAGGLSGRVVVVDFWTYSCINCLRAIPYVRAWAEKYKADGLIVIGVHAPEFAFEKNLDNVRKAVSDLKIGYPVAVDNDYTIWRAFKNQYWPAHYFIDARGQIRHHHFGEGGYDESERVIQQLLKEAGTTTLSTDLVSVNAAGVEAAPDLTDVQSPETYLGYERAEHFVSSGGAVRDSRHVYATETPRLNEWGLAGDWTISVEQAKLNTQGGRIVYRFHARDLHLVLGPAPEGKPVRFRVTIDGAPPGTSRGVDVDADGQGVVTRHRLYQLIRQSGQIIDHTFEIRFFDPGVYAYAFTFG